MNTAREHGGRVGHGRGRVGRGRCQGLGTVEGGMRCEARVGDAGPRTGMRRGWASSKTGMHSQAQSPSLVPPGPSSSLLAPPRPSCPCWTRPWTRFPLVLQHGPWNNSRAGCDGRRRRRRHCLVAPPRPLSTYVPSLPPPPPPPPPADSLSLPLSLSLSHSLSFSFSSRALGRAGESTFIRARSFWILVRGKKLRVVVDRRPAGAATAATTFFFIHGLGGHVEGWEAQLQHFRK